MVLVESICLCCFAAPLELKATHSYVALLAFLTALLNICYLGTPRLPRYRGLHFRGLLTAFCGVDSVSLRALLLRPRNNGVCEWHCRSVDSLRDHRGGCLGDVHPRRIQFDGTRALLPRRDGACFLRRGQDDDDDDASAVEEAEDVIVFVHASGADSSERLGDVAEAALRSND